MTKHTGEERKKPLSASSMSNVRNLMSSIFTQAVEDGHLEINPARGLGRFIRKSRDRKAHIRSLTREQVKAVLIAAKEWMPKKGTRKQKEMDRGFYYPVFLCGFRTGMRQGEMLGLAWEDVDFEGKCITVRRSWSHYRFSTPKTHKSRRVDMSDQLAEALKAHRRNLLDRFGGNLPSVPVPPDMALGDTIQLLFPYTTGKQLDPSWFRRKSHVRGHWPTVCNL